jgi:Flp pilus assembly protein TadD
MALSAFRKAPLAVLLMLGCVPAHAGWFSSDSKPAEKAAKVEDKAAVQPPAATLDDSIRQAQMLRLAAQYPEAIKHLSQLMMVASDDGRVISEYGKTLTAMGRASDAVGFLTRAQQLQPGDWTIYSAMGVAYDQIGDQKNAQIAYEQALAIKPGEPSVLNNYALSRMLAKDPEMARKLAARAESAGGTADDKIARNIAMIRSLAPETPAAQTQTVAARAPETHGNRVVMQPVPVDPLAGPMHPAAKPNPIQVATKPAPENLAPVATQAPRPLQSKSAQAENTKEPVSKSVISPAKVVETAVASPAMTPPAPMKAAEPKPAPVAIAKVAPPAPVKAAEAKPMPVADGDKPATSAKAIPPAPVKTNPVPAPAIVAKAMPPVPLKTAETKPAAETGKPAPATVAKAPAAAKLAAVTPVPVKAADKVTPVAAAKVMLPAPVKTAEAASPSVTLKMAPVKTAEADKTVSAPKVLPGKTKDAVPGLRMSANAY